MADGDKVMSKATDNCRRYASIFLCGSYWKSVLRAPSCSMLSTNLRNLSQSVINGTPTAQMLLSLLSELSCISISWCMHWNQALGSELLTFVPLAVYEDEQFV